jgi:chromosome segregation ATPase
VALALSYITPARGATTGAPHQLWVSLPGLGLGASAAAKDAALKQATAAKDAAAAQLESLREEARANSGEVSEQMAARLEAAAAAAEEQVERERATMLKQMGLLEDELQAAARALDGAAEWMADMDSAKNDLVQQLLTKEDQLEELVRLLQEQEENRLGLKMKLERASDERGSLDLSAVPSLAADDEGMKMQLQAKAAEVAALKLASNQRKTQLVQAREEATRLMVRAWASVGALLGRRVECTASRVERVARIRSLTHVVGMGGSCRRIGLLCSSSWTRCGEWWTTRHRQQWSCSPKM